MNTHARKLLVIIGEAALEKALVRDARSFGAHGYTVSEVRGGGERGDREARWEADRSIEMKVICDEALAQRLAQHVLQTYAADYALTLFTADVGVFRPQKF
ncbi:MAG: transcriptional regulator [Burkholderiales bacterium]|jgi:nitrogen regulatory protein P-II 2|nr:MAG: transcriptional regulator [Burkholderiales bacterium]